jgi:2-methylcitrate dehydratase PrpD
LLASEIAAIAVRLVAQGIGEQERSRAATALASATPHRTSGPAVGAAVTDAIRAAAYGPDGEADPLTRALLRGADAPAGPAWPWRVVAAVLDEAEPRRPEPGGPDVVVAALVGAEVAYRFATAVDTPVAAAWDPAGGFGVLGAAVTASLLTAADADQLASALAIAASLTSGHRVHTGTPLGQLAPGFAASAGVLAAALARRGVTGSPTALEGPRGLCFGYGDRAAAGRVLDGLGTHWRVLDDVLPTAVAQPPRSPAADDGGDDDLAGALAAFAAGVRLADLPEPVRQAGRRTLANAVGLAVDAAHHPAVEAVAATLADLGLRGDTRAIGRPDPVSPYAAALLMGYAMHVEDFDDTHLRTVLHPGAPVVGAALAAAQLAGASGADLLAGVVAGVEVGSRLGIALGPGHFDRGWHVTGTVGHVGAAAAAARVLGLSAEQTRRALVIAGTLASGVTEQLGSMTKALHVGRSAADGLQAALLARAGITGARPAFGGPGGLRAALSPEYDPAAALAGLGHEWELTANAFKPYSCGIVSHPVIDAAIAARTAGLTADDIERVVATVRPVVLEVMGVAEPRDGLQSKFSVYHCFAVGLLDGGAGPAQYSDARATDPAVVALRRKVEAVTDPDMPKDACRVEVFLRGGDSRAFVVEHATGSVDAPMTDAQLENKVRLLTEPVLGPGWSELWRSAMTVDTAAGVADLLARAVRS